MHAYPIPDRNTPQVNNSRLVERPLYVDRGSHTFGRMAKDDHETVALRLDHLAMMAPHIVLNYAVVSLEQIYPLIVSEPLVVDGRALDVGEEDRHVAIGRRYAHDRRPVLVRPTGDVVDRGDQKAADTAVPNTGGRLDYPLHRCPGNEATARNPA